MASITTSAVVTECDQQNESDGSQLGDALASTLSAGNGRAIAAVIVSEYAASAHRAQHESDMTSDGKGVRGETNGIESPIAYIQRRVRKIVAKSNGRQRP